MNRTVPYYELNGLTALLVETKKILNFLEEKGFVIPTLNVRLFTDSEIVLIWVRILRTRFQMGTQTLISKCTIIMNDLDAKNVTSR